MNHLEFPTNDNIYIYQPETTLQRWQTTLLTIAISLIAYYGWSYVAYHTAIKRILYESAQSVLPVQILRILRKSAILPPLQALQNLDEDGSVKKLHEGSGVVSVVQKARTLSGLDKLLPIASNVTYTGLHNWDNSCFQNSVLQGLASLDIFRDAVHRGAQKCSALKVDCSTQEALDIFLDHLHRENTGKNTIWPPAALRTMNTWHQQDAQEYFSKVVEVIEKEVSRYAQHALKSRAMSFTSLRDIRSTIYTRVSEEGRIEPNNLSALFAPNPLEGLLSESLRCQACGYSEGLSLMPFNFLTLNLGPGSGYYLEELIDAYTDPELIEGVECDECTRQAHTGSDSSTVASTEMKPSSTIPKVKSTKAKQSVLARLPQDLVLHINRSIFDDYGNQRKNTAAVRFPTSLEIVDEWMEGSISSSQANVHAFYELRCVVTHSGRHDNGHYVAIGKRGKSWYSFNDEIVTKVSEDDVSSRGNVFMLFYEKINSPPILEVPVSESDASETEVD